LVGSVEVLKVGHHGSNGSTGGAWLEELAPRVSVVSVGTNRYGHPTADVLERLRSHGSSVWRTDVLGPITISTDGHEVRVSARGRKESLSASPN
jgi:competence protein ComEC